MLPPLRRWMIPLLKDEHMHVLVKQLTPSVGLHLNPERKYKETKKNLATCNLATFSTSTSGDFLLCNLTSQVTDGQIMKELPQ